MSETYKVWVSIEEYDAARGTYTDLDPAPVGVFDTLQEAADFARTIGWTPLSEDTAYEARVKGDK